MNHHIDSKVQKQTVRTSPGYCRCCGKSYEYIDSELIPTCLCSQYVSLVRVVGFAVPIVVVMVDTFIGGKRS